VRSAATCTLETELSRERFCATTNATYRSPVARDGAASPAAAGEDAVETEEEEIAAES
jgi:hypothetical protein